MLKTNGLQDTFKIGSESLIKNGLDKSPTCIRGRTTYNI